MDESVFAAHPASVVIRVLILLVGFTLFTACLKFAWLAMRNREGYRAWGIAAFGLIVVTPAVAGLYNFDRSLQLAPTLTYAAGLICGLIALRTSYTVSSDWARIRARNARRREGRRRV